MRIPAFHLFPTGKSVELRFAIEYFLRPDYILQPSGFAQI